MVLCDFIAIFALVYYRPPLTSVNTQYPSRPGSKGWGEGENAKRDVTPKGVDFEIGPVPL